MDKLDLNFKGYIDIYIRNIDSDDIIQEIHQENLFTNNGRKLALTQLNPYIILSTSTETPAVTATVIPSTARAASSQSPSPTISTAGTSVTKRYYYQFPVPTDQSDVIGTVGLSSSNAVPTQTASSVIAYTKLSQTISRTINVTVIDVYYSITINSY